MNEDRNTTFSVLVGLKNNLAYTAYFYRQARQLYPEIELVFVSFNSTDGTHQWLDALRDNRVTYYYEERERTLSDTYNKCIELATSDYVVFAHNDMVLAPGFIEQLAALQTDNQVVFYTTVEPPVFADDPRPGKLVRDFGTDLATFQWDAFVQFTLAEQRRNEQSGQTAVPTGKGIFFLAASRKRLLDIGGLDPLFNPMFCEDDDLLLRLGISGVAMIIGLNVLCYHFVSKTSRFSAEYANRTKQIERQSNRNFIRKWGFSNSAVVRHTYDIGLILTNATEATLRELEPWAVTVYTDLDPAPYIRDEQPHTAVDLTEKIKSLTAARTNGVLVSLDVGKADSTHLEQVARLPEIIHQRITRPRSTLKQLWYRLFPEFTWRGYRIRIVDPTTHETRLIRKELTYA